VSRRDPQARTTKDQILVAALAVFTERGYHQATVEEIAERAGLTKGAFYYYFRDKTDVGADLQHDVFEKVTARALRAVAEADGEDTIALMTRGFEGFVAALSEMPEVASFLREAWLVADLDVAGRADQDDVVSLLRGLVDAGVAAGELVETDPHALARVLFGMFMEATFHILDVGEAAPTVAVLRRFLEALRVAEATSGLPEPRRPAMAATGVSDVADPQGAKP